MPKIIRGRISGFDGMQSYTAVELHNWADELEGQMKEPLSRDDPKWLLRWSKKIRHLAIQKERAHEHKVRRSKRKIN